MTNSVMGQDPGMYCDVCSCGCMANSVMEKIQICIVMCVYANVWQIVLWEKIRICIVTSVHADV